MKFVGKSGLYKGQIEAPASKSYLQRALAIALLTTGKSVLHGYSPSNDVSVALDIIQKLGAKVKVIGNSIEIIGTTNLNSNAVLNCGEAGLSSRMFSAISSLSSSKVIVSGEGSIMKRPMHMVEEALTQLGKNVKSCDGNLPLELDGVMHGGEIRINGSESSQLLTGLLIALPLLQQDSIIHVESLKSVPYVKMTLAILEEFSVYIEHDDFKIFKIKGNQGPMCTDYQVEGDWSGAAFHLVAAAISGQVEMTRLLANSLQADARILDVLKNCGANVVFNSDHICVSKNELNAFCFDATDCPDLFPPLVVLAACCNGQSVISGVSRLKHKESDRAKTLQSEFKRVGVEIKIEGDNMLIDGTKVKGGKVDSHNDHRIAMAMTILSLVAENEIEIDNFEAINKSYPKFLEDFILSKMA